MKKKEKISIKNTFDDVISSSKKLEGVSTKLNEPQNDNFKNKVDSNKVESDDESSESICSDELNELQQQLDKILNDKLNIDNLVKNKDEQLCDLRCEESYEKRKIIKNKEREEEKKIYLRLI